MHWYGLTPMKETLQRINDESVRLRAEKSEGNSNQKTVGSKQ